MFNISKTEVPANHGLLFHLTFKLTECVKYREEHFSEASFNFKPVKKGNDIQ